MSNPTAATDPGPLPASGPSGGGVKDPDSRKPLSRTTDLTGWFAQEVHPHDGQLKSYLRGKYPSVRDVEDIVQESYLRIWKAKAAHPIECAKAFLFQVARHLALDTIRKGRNAPTETGCDYAALRVLDPGPSADEALLTRDLFDQVIDVLISLPTHYRNVLVLHKLKGLSHKEIALKLGITERTAQKYSSVGLDLCAQKLKSRGIDCFFG